MMAQLTDEEIRQRLQAMPGWERTPEGLRKTLRRKDFQAAIRLVDQVAEAAEQANHHPDILIHGWNRVTFTLMTHSERAITERDFALAAQIDRLAG